jgi:hypothetical protein
MTSLATARVCLRALLALSTLVGFVWSLARLAGARASRRCCGSAGASIAGK